MVSKINQSSDDISFSTEFLTASDLQIKTLASRFKYLTNPLITLISNSEV